MSEIDRGNTFGISQLDNIILGTMRPGSMGLLYGPTGTGKSSVAAHFAFQGARDEENVLFLTTDPVRGIIKDMSRFRSWNPNWIDDGFISVMRMQDLLEMGGLSLESIDGSDIDLLYDLVISAVDSTQSKRLVIDPADPLLNIILEKRPYLFLDDLKCEAFERDLRILLVTDGLLDPAQGGFGSVFHHHFDIIIEFNRVKGATSFNTLTVKRWKSSPHSRSTYVLDVSETGIIMIPKIQRSEVE